MSTVYPAKYLQLNSIPAKRLNVVVSIQDLEMTFSLLPVYEKLRYGDPRLTYGLPGLKYGGYILLANQMQILMKDGLNISQVIEPEQGRGSVSTMTLKLIDKNEYITQLISPGVLLDEPLGNKLVTVFVGYQNSAYPDDYFRIFRGYMSNSTSGAGWVSLELSDANIKNRQNVFDGGSNYTAEGVSIDQTVIPINVVDSFFKPIIGPTGTTDWQLNTMGGLDLTQTVRAFILIDSEWMEYGPTGILQVEETAFTGSFVAGSNQITGCVFPVTGAPTPGMVLVSSGLQDGSSQISFTGNVSVGSGSVTGCVYGDLPVMPGQEISGPGILPNTTIAATTQAVFTGTLTFPTNAITGCVFSAGTPSIGDQIFVSGVPSGTTVSNVIGTTVVMSANATTNATTSILTLSPNISLSQNANLATTGAALVATEVATTIVSVTGPTITTSANALVTSLGAPIVAVPTITVFRGGEYSQGTTPDVHSADAAVTNAIQLYGNPIEIALKVMLSGWGGPWIVGEPCVAIGTTIDPTNPNNAAILFNIDVVQEYGVTVGDQVLLAGGPNAGSYFIIAISNADQNEDLNRVITVSLTQGGPAHTLIIDNPATSTVGFRSQYDTLPIACGLSNTPQDVDVATFQSVMSSFFSTGFTFQLFEDAEQTGKDWIESEIYLPLGIYSITRYGRLSVAVTKPPLVTQRLIQLDQSNVLQPANITIQRALNTRRFYNLVQYNYDLESDGQTYGTQDNFIDDISETVINLTSTIAINSSGLKTALGGAAVSAQRGLFILNRYKKAAFEVSLKCNWESGSQIEVGDMVIVYDPRTLQISNFETGARGLGRALFEVINRSLDIANGVAALTLLSSLGYTTEQRYATIAPSSLIVSATPTAILIKDSFGPEYPGDEQQKWINFLGLPITVHSPDYTTRNGTAVLLGFDPANPYSMLLKGTGLPFTPQPGDVVEVGPYGSGWIPFTYIDPTLTVVTGISLTQFTVSVSDAALVVPGLPVIIRDLNWDVLSPEIVVKSIVGQTVTLAKSLDFIPVAGYFVDLGGFVLDGGGAFRIL